MGLSYQIWKIELEGYFIHNIPIYQIVHFLKFLIIKELRNFFDLSLNSNYSLLQFISRLDVLSI